MQTLATIVFTACILGGFVCWGVAVYNMFRTVALRKPGVSKWHGTWFNPFNLLLQPGKLTDAGLVARKRCFFGLLRFLACWVLAVLVGSAVGLD